LRDSHFGNPSKRTDVSKYRLQSPGDKAFINMKATAKTGKVTGINLVDDTTASIPRA
jgi:DNA gyrase subunit A